MSHEAAGRSPKSLVEHAVCFSCTAAALTGFAVVLKWIFQLL